MGDRLITVICGDGEVKIPFATLIESAKYFKDLYEEGSEENVVDLSSVGAHISIKSI